MHSPIQVHKLRHRRTNLSSRSILPETASSGRPNLIPMTSSPSRPHGPQQSRINRRTIGDDEPVRTIGSGSTGTRAKGGQPTGQRSRTTTARLAPAVEQTHRQHATNLSIRSSPHSRSEERDQRNGSFSQNQLAYPHQNNPPRHAR